MNHLKQWDQSQDMKTEGLITRFMWQSSLTTMWPLEGRKGGEFEGVTVLGKEKRRQEPRGKNENRRK